MASAQDTKQTQDLKAASSPLMFKRTSVVAPPRHKGCACSKWRCQVKVCPCMKNDYRCTSKCSCIGCDNVFGAKGSDPDTGLDMNELPEEAEDPDSGFDLNELPKEAENPAQIEEQPTQSGDNRDSDQNKRPRNK